MTSSSDVFSSISSTISKESSIVGSTMSVYGTIESIKDLTSSAKGEEGSSSTEKLTQTASFISNVSKVGNGFVTNLPPVGGVGGTASSVLGSVGAIGSLTSNTIRLGVRVGEAYRINRELEKVPEGAQYKREILESLSSHAKAKVVSSAVGVASDTLSVAGSFVPVVGPSASAVSVPVAILRIIAEHRIDGTLKKKLEKITEDYRKNNSGMIENPQAFRELLQAIKDQYAKVKIAKDGAEKAYQDAVKAYEKALETEKPLGTTFVRIGEASSTHNKAKTELQQMTDTLKECEAAKADLEAYEAALNLIRDLQPPREEIEAEGEREENISKLTRFSTMTNPESFAFFSETAIEHPTTRREDRVPPKMYDAFLTKTEPTPGKEPKQKIEDENEKQLGVFKMVQLSTLSSPELLAFSPETIPEYPTTTTHQDQETPKRVEDSPKKEKPKQKKENRPKIGSDNHKTSLFSDIYIPEALAFSSESLAYI